MVQVIPFNIKKKKEKAKIDRQWYYSWEKFPISAIKNVEGGFHFN